MAVKVTVMEEGEGGVGVERRSMERASEEGEGGVGV